MRIERNTLSKLIRFNCLLLFYGMTIACSQSPQYAFEEEIKRGTYYQNDVALPLLIYTTDEPIMLIEGYCMSIIKEISKYNNIDKNCASTILYNSLKRDLPIQVSEQFYKCSIEDRIKIDFKADSVYKEQGIKGILNNYCTKSDKLLVLEEIPENERFQGNHLELGYIIYLLSLHDIYVAYFDGFEDHTLLIFIAKEISNLP